LFMWSQPNEVQDKQQILKYMYSGMIN